MIRIGSLFTGIGGLDLGVLTAFAEVGVPSRVLWSVEIDDFCDRVLRARFPETTRYRDVRECNRENLEPIDILIGGFACQDVSSAGTGKGLGKETRSGLTWTNMLRLIGELRPAAVVIENVASGARRWLPQVVEELRRAGYRSVAVPLRALDVGAPHLRKRIFLVGLRDDGDMAHADERGHARERLGAQVRGGGIEAEARRDLDGRGGARRGEGGVEPSGERLVSDAFGDLLRDEQQRVSARRPGGVRDAREDGPRADGADGTMGVAEVGGCGQGDGRADGAPRGRRRSGDAGAAGAAPGGGSGTVAHAAGEGRERPDGDEGACGERRAEEQSLRRGDAACDARAIESGVGAHADGLPFDVARHAFPAGRGQAQKAWEPPRALPGDVKVPDRRKKLRAVGNAVVPQCGLVVGRVLIALGRGEVKVA